MRRFIVSSAAAAVLLVASMAPVAADHTEGGKGACPAPAGDPEPFAGDPGSAPDLNGDGLICNVRSLEGTAKERVATVVDNNVADLHDLPEHPHDEGD